MLGDTYSDDEPPDLKVPSEMAAHLLLNPKFSGNRFTYSTENPPTVDSFTLSDQTSARKDITETWENGLYQTTENFSAGSTDTLENDMSPNDEYLSYKLGSSKYEPTEFEHGFRAWNSLSRKDQDVDRQEFFKNMARKDKSRKMDQEELERIVENAVSRSGGSNEDDVNTTGAQTTPNANIENLGNFNGNKDKRENITYPPLKMITNNNEKVGTKTEMENSVRYKRLETTSAEGSANAGESSFDSGNEDAVKSHPWGLVFTVIGTVLLDFDADACQSPSRAYMLDVTIPGKLLFNL